MGIAALNIAGAEPSMRFLRRVGGLYAGLSFNRRRLKRAMENIAWCFPHWDQATVREYAIESHRHLFCLAAEVGLSPRLLSSDGFPAHVQIGEMGRGLLAYFDDRPSMLITGHCGNWELLGYTLAMLGFPMHALYRPLDLAPLDAWLHETRSRRGLELVDKFGAAASLPQLLKAGKPVGFIADQNAGDRGVFVPFFNRLASAYKTIGLLAIQHGATIICGHARRLSGMNGGGVEPVVDRPGLTRPATHRGRAPGLEARESQTFRYCIELVDSFGPEDWSDQPDPLFYITARYRRAIETMVRLAPEQYLWMHRYWKSRPPHEQRDRPFPAQLREKIAALPWIDDDDLAQIVERSERDASDLRAARHHHHQRSAPHDAPMPGAHEPPETPAFQ